MYPHAHAARLGQTLTALGVGFHLRHLPASSCTRPSHNEDAITSDICFAVSRNDERAMPEDMSMIPYNGANLDVVLYVSVLPTIFRS